MKKSLKKYLIFLVMVALLLTTACTSNETQSTTPESSNNKSSDISANLRMGTTGVTGVYYLVGTAFSQTMGKFYPEIKINVEVTDGSISNMQMIGSDDLDIGIALSDIVYEASKGGTKSFPEPVELKAITAINEGLVHLIVAKNSGISSIEDLKGKRVATGQPGYVAEVTALAILEAKGIDIKKDCTWQRIGFADAMDAIADGRTDAIFYQAGAPVPSITEAATNTNKINILPIEKEVIEMVTSKSEYLIASQIPAGAYGNTEPIPTVCSINLMVCSPELEEDVVYTLIKTLYDNIDDWKSAHSSLNFINNETAVIGSPIEFHPGAIQYYKEIGVLK
jgi:hypothetical protein